MGVDGEVQIRRLHHVDFEGRNLISWLIPSSMGASYDGNTGGAPLLKWEDNTIGNSRIIGGEEE